MSPEPYTSTREQLHGVAETLIAGPQYRMHRTIRLAPRPGGFGGVRFLAAVEGADLIWPSGRAALTGRSAASIAAFAGIEFGMPAGVYHDHPVFDPNQVLDLDRDATAMIADWFALGEAALRVFAPAAEPVLWPEHFDVAIVVGEVNYGVSPGDASHPGPYAYVGPWTGDTVYRPREAVPTIDALVNFFRQQP